MAALTGCETNAPKPTGAPSVLGSICYGTPADGSLQGGVQIPLEGPNFEVIRWKDAPPRLSVHSTVKRILEDALRAMETAKPGTSFLIGETGLERGGTLSGHKTHRNGTSADLFVPVRDASDGTPMLFTNDFRNGYGYKERFDAQGAAAGRMRIDFETLAEYIFQLHTAAKNHGAGIQRVILIKDYQEKLKRTARGAYISSNVRFFDDPADRHDNHIHVDFAVACQPK